MPRVPQVPRVFLPMRLTTKGQVTIPLDIRERLGLLPYTEVEFEIDGDAVKIRKARRGAGRGRDLVDRMRGEPLHD